MSRGLLNGSELARYLKTLPRDQLVRLHSEVRSIFRRAELLAIKGGNRDKNNRSLRNSALKVRAK